jgi:glutamyl-tRNA reductase
MTLAVVGVNHKTAPIALRERIAISRDDLAETTRALAAVEGVTECMIVSTCNRVELLAAVEGPDTDLTGFLHNHFGLDRDCLSRTSTSGMIAMRCGICFAWRPAWTPWWWASRRFWAR